MKKLIVILILMLATVSYAADLSMKWDPATGAGGYKIYASADVGLTWDAGVDVGNVTTYVYIGVPEDGLILFRISAYGAQGETIRYWDGVWYNATLKPPDLPAGYGLE